MRFFQLEYFNIGLFPILFNKGSIGMKLWTAELFILFKKYFQYVKVSRLVHNVRVIKKKAGHDIRESKF